MSGLWTLLEGLTIFLMIATLYRRGRRAQLHIGDHSFELSYVVTKATKWFSFHHVWRCRHHHITKRLHESL